MKSYFSLDNSFLLQPLGAETVKFIFISYLQHNILAEMMNENVIKLLFHFPLLYGGRNSMPPGESN